MINMINISPVLSIFGQHVLKTGEMLIMLIFCPFCPPPPPLRGGGGPKVPKKINMINMINISPVLSTFFENKD